MKISVIKKHKAKSAMPVEYTPNPILDEKVTDEIEEENIQDACTKRNPLCAWLKNYFSNWITLVSLPYHLTADCELKISWLRLLIHYVLAFATIWATGMIFELRMKPIAALLVVYFLFSPRLIYFHYKRHYEQQLFTESIRYMESMLYSFSRNSKILEALQESRFVTKGKLLAAIDYAIEEIQTSSSTAQDLYANALCHIEAILPNSRVKNMHEFFIEVENKGGRHETALDIMIEDVRGWDIRVNQFIADQKTKINGILLSILLCLGTSLFMVNIVPSEAGGHIANMMAYQAITTVLIIVLFLFYRFIAKYLTQSWVTETSEKSDKSLQKDLDKVEKYLSKNKKHAKPLAAMSRIELEVEKLFPRWVMKFALLISSLPVPVALNLSIDSAPKVMKPELEKLVDRINQDPNGMEPYIRFFDYLDLPQIRSMMIMIHNLSGYSTRDIDKHVFGLVKRNYTLQDNAEKLESEESMARFSIYVIIPMIITCLVIIVNVALIVLNMMSKVATTIQF